MGARRHMRVTPWHLFLVVATVFLGADGLRAQSGTALSKQTKATSNLLRLATTGPLDKEEVNELGAALDASHNALDKLPAVRPLQWNANITAAEWRGVCRAAISAAAARLAIERGVLAYKAGKWREGAGALEDVEFMLALRPGRGGHTLSADPAYVMGEDFKGGPYARLAFLEKRLNDISPGSKKTPDAGVAFFLSAGSAIGTRPSCAHVGFDGNRKDPHQKAVFSYITGHDINGNKLHKPMLQAAGDLYKHHLATDQAPDLKKTVSAELVIGEGYLGFWGLAYNVLDLETSTALGSDDLELRLDRARSWLEAHEGAVDKRDQPRIKKLVSYVSARKLLIDPKELATAVSLIHGHLRKFEEVSEYPKENSGDLYGNACARIDKLKVKFDGEIDDNIESLLLEALKGAGDIADAQVWRSYIFSLALSGTLAWSCAVQSQKPTSCPAKIWNAPRLRSSKTHAEQFLDDVYKASFPKVSGDWREPFAALKKECTDETRAPGEGPRSGDKLCKASDMTELVMMIDAALALSAYEDFGLTHAEHILSLGFTNAPDEDALAALGCFDDDGGGLASVTQGMGSTNRWSRFKPYLGAGEAARLEEDRSALVTLLNEKQGLARHLRNAVPAPEGAREGDGAAPAFSVLRFELSLALISQPLTDDLLQADVRGAKITSRPTFKEASEAHLAVAKTLEALGRAKITQEKIRIEELAATDLMNAYAFKQWKSSTHESILDAQAAILGLARMQIEDQEKLTDLSEQIIALQADRAQNSYEAQHKTLQLATEYRETLKGALIGRRAMIKGVEEAVAQVKKQLEDTSRQIDGDADKLAKELKEQRKRDKFIGDLRKIVTIGSIVAAPFTGGTSLQVGAMIQQGISAVDVLSRKDAFKDLDTGLETIAIAGAHVENAASTYDSLADTNVASEVAKFRHGFGEAVEKYRSLETLIGNINGEKTALGKAFALVDGVSFKCKNKSDCKEVELDVAEVSFEITLSQKDTENFAKTLGQALAYGARVERYFKRNGKVIEGNLESIYSEQKAALKELEGTAREEAERELASMLNAMTGKSLSLKQHDEAFEALNKELGSSYAKLGEEDRRRVVDVLDELSTKTGRVLSVEVGDTNKTIKIVGAVPKFEADFKRLEEALETGAENEIGKVEQELSEELEKLQLVVAAFEKKAQDAAEANNTGKMKDAAKQISAQAVKVNEVLDRFNAELKRVGRAYENQMTVVEIERSELIAAELDRQIADIRNKRVRLEGEMIRKEFEKSSLDSQIHAHMVELNQGSATRAQVAYALQARRKAMLTDLADRISSREDQPLIYLAQLGIRWRSPKFDVKTTPGKARAKYFTTGVQMLLALFEAFPVIDRKKLDVPLALAKLTRRTRGPSPSREEMIKEASAALGTPPWLGSGDSFELDTGPTVRPLSFKVGSGQWHPYKKTRGVRYVAFVPISLSFDSDATLDEVQCRLRVQATAERVSMLWYPKNKTLRESFTKDAKPAESCKAAKQIPLIHSADALDKGYLMAHGYKLTDTGKANALTPRLDATSGGGSGAAALNPEYIIDAPQPDYYAPEELERWPTPVGRSVSSGGNSELKEAFGNPKRDTRFYFTPVEGIYVLVLWVNVRDQPANDLNLDFIFEALPSKL